jgi:hypothetical protein
VRDLRHRPLAAVTDPTTMRATYDAQVVRAWQQALAAHPPSLRRAAAVAAIVALVSLGLCCAPALQGGAFARALLGSGLAELLIAALLLALDHERRTADLCCPHCRRNPAGIRRQAAIWIDHCAHCLYWLKTPPWIVQAPDDAARPPT